MAEIKDMSIAQMKQELIARRVDFSDCIEKHELVARLTSARLSTVLPPAHQHEVVSSDEEEGEEGEEEGDDNFGLEFLDTFKSIAKPGNYCCGGKVDYFVSPGLEVQGVGPVTFPLQPQQAKDILSQASLAPFGRGEKTIHDKNVRNTWQLDPASFSLNNPDWALAVHRLLPLIKAEMGVTDSIMFRANCFFKTHTDSEKEKGMFGTFVIILPSLHGGGELHVRHGGQERVFDFGPSSSYNSHYIAFYADCQHEIKPVTSGYRLALVYNLIYAGAGVCPTPVNNQNLISRLVRTLSEWNKGGGPDKFVFMFDHKYSQVGLGFTSLKNRDRAIAQIMREAVQAEGKGTPHFELYLGIVKLAQSGYEDGYSDQIDTSEYSISHFTSLDDGKPLNINQLSIDNESELLPQDYFEGKSPVDQTREETGNEGTNIEKWYEAAGLVIWPIGARWSMRVHAGLESAVAELAAMTQAGAPPHDTQEFAVAIINAWDHSLSPELMAQNLIAIGDLRLARHYMQNLAQNKAQTKVISYSFLHHSRGTNTPGAIAALLKLCEHFAWDDSMLASLASLFEKTETVETMIQMLHELVAVPVAESARSKQKALCIKVATHVVEKVVQNSAHPPDSIYVKMQARADLVAWLLMDLHTIDAPALTNKYLEHVSKCRKGQSYMFHDFETCLVPAIKTMCSLFGEDKWKGISWLVSLYEGTVNDLQEIVTSALTPPPTWSLKPKSSYSCCGDCAAFQAFMTDPNKTTYRLKEIAKRRTHVERNNTHIDLKFDTDRTGSPQTLIATKTRTSWEQRKQQRMKEQILLQELHKLWGAEPSKAKRAKVG